MKPNYSPSINNPFKNSRNYLSYATEIINLAKIKNLNVYSYSPYIDFPELKTIFIYNQSLVDSEVALIHTSGLHGIEGYAGAEIQKHILHQKGDFLAKSNAGILMIFALNPFGFHFLRRASIENIDLNRNSANTWNQASHEIGNQWFRRLWRSNSIVDLNLGLIQSFGIGILKGLNYVTQNFPQGQNLESKGIFFSGNQESIEIKTFFNKLKPLIQNKKELFVLDVHTGIGSLYQELLIDQSNLQGEIHKNLTLRFEVDEFHSAGYKTEGTLFDQIKKEFPTPNIQFIVQEFGIKGTSESLLALALENIYHWNHVKHINKPIYLKHPIKKYLLETFFSEDSNWLHWTKETGLKRFLQMMPE